jgi:hypothetical protein
MGRERLALVRFSEERGYPMIEGTEKIIERFYHDLWNPGNLTWPTRSSPRMFAFAAPWGSRSKGVRPSKAKSRR